MDLNIKLISKSDVLSASTLSGMLSNFTHTIERTIYNTMCELNKNTSRKKIENSVIGKVHLEIVSVERGSFIFIITGAVAGTIASCFYDAVKKVVFHKLTHDEVSDTVKKHLPLLIDNIKKEFSDKKRLGYLLVNEVKIDVNNTDKMPLMNIEIILGAPKKERMPFDSESQIDYVIRMQELKQTKREMK